METVLITGGSGTLGRIMVRDLSAAGYRIVFTATRTERVQSVVAECGGQGREVVGIVADLCAPGAIESLLADLERQSLRIHHLVNNARSLKSLAVAGEGVTLRKEFMDELELDVIVPYELSMGLARQPLSTLKSVVNVGSQYGVVAFNPSLYDDPDTQAPIQYAVAKAALAHLTKELAVRLAGRKVRVNCVALGGVEGRVDSAFQARYASLSPSRRMLVPSEVSGPVRFLISAESSAVTGHVLVADAGWTAW